MNRAFARLTAILLLCAAAPLAAPRRILYVTATYGFRHSDSIDASVDVFQQLAQQSGAFEIDHTEDVSRLNATNLRNYDAVYFFTSGELPLSDQQKADLLDFSAKVKASEVPIARPTVTTAGPIMATSSAAISTAILGCRKPPFRLKIRRVLW